GGAVSTTGGASFLGGLTMTGGALSGAGPIILDGVSSWTGGQMTGPGLTLALGTLTVSGSTGFLGRTIANQGRLIWNQPALIMENVGIINQAGTLEIQSNLEFAGGFLINQGSLVRSGPVGSVSLTGTTFTNSGHIQLRLGPTSDALGSHANVQLGGSLELVLQPGFDPPDGAQ